MKNIPVISITKKTLAEAYEAALVSLYEQGTRFKTQYDQPGDPLLRALLPPAHQGPH